MNKKLNVAMRIFLTVIVMIGLGRCVMADNNGHFKLLGKTIDPREGSTATLLKNGKVLITGGYPAVSSAEIYDPKTQKFTRTGNLNVGRYGHSAILLQDGRVLISGGNVKNYNKQHKYIGDGFTELAEIYDPSTAKFTTVKMIYPFTENNSILLQDGRVLISGLSDKLEIFDPKVNEFKMTSSCLTKVCPDNVTLLNDGKVLFASGYFPDNQPQLFNSKTESIEYTGKMNLSRTFSTATLLKNGEVIIIGGQHNYDDIAQAEIYNPETETFRLAGKLNQPRNQHSSVLLTNGKILVLGGSYGHSSKLNYFKSAELYDPSVDKFFKIKDMNYIRVNPATTKLPDGNILIVGGSENDNDIRPELFINK